MARYELGVFFPTFLISHPECAADALVFAVNGYVAREHVLKAKIEGREIIIAGCTDERLLYEHLMILRKDQFVENSNNIFELIARKRLIKSVPPVVRPTQLLAYLSADDIDGVFHSLLVKHDRSGHTLICVKPQILVYPSITLLRHDGQLITVQDGQEYALPHDFVKLEEHKQEVATAATALLNCISKELGQSLQPMEINTFPGFPSRPKQQAVTALGSLGETRITYLDTDPIEADQYKIVTGIASLFLLPLSTPQSCHYHNWTNCKSKGVEVGANAITSRSIKPPAFFFSGEPHHCAHQDIHDRREQRCKIDALDKHLCCQHCAFWSACWPVDFIGDLPCPS